MVYGDDIAWPWAHRLKLLGLSQIALPTELMRYGVLKMPVDTPNLEGLDVTALDDELRGQVCRLIRLADCVSYLEGQ